jgi:hypothetical protein
MSRARTARPDSPVPSRDRPYLYDGAPIGRERAIDRVAKLEAITESRGAAPSEAEFASRRAQALNARFGLADHGVGPGRKGSGSSMALVSAERPPSPQDVIAAAAAYRNLSRYKRSKSALRFLENA